MRVLRIECKRCRHSNPHGPHAYRCQDIEAPRPQFGGIINPPDMDRNVRTGGWLGIINGREFCGVLPSQYDNAWSRTVYDWPQDTDVHYERKIHAPWVLACYEVEEKFARVGRQQVVFELIHANLVWESHDPYDRRIFEELVAENV